MNKIIVSLILLFLTATNALSSQSADLHASNVRTITNNIMDISLAFVEDEENNDVFARRYGFGSNLEQFTSQALMFNQVTALVSDEAHLSKKSLKRYRAICESFRESCDYYLKALDSYSKEHDLKGYSEIIKQYIVEVEKLMNLADRNSKIE